MIDLGLLQVLTAPLLGAIEARTVRECNGERECKSEENERPNPNGGKIERD